MKKLFYLIICIAFIAGAGAQTVGIGTNTPNANSILDIFSNNKGFLMPRINDTPNVANPLEGMVIYNKNTKAPFYHNGNQWLSLGARLPAAQPQAGAMITYKVTYAGFSGAELPAFSAQVGMGFNITPPNPPSATSVSEFTFTKELDINSMHFQLATLKGTLATDIEFKFYASGASIPYLSYRFKTVYFTGFSISSGGDRPSEAINVFYKNYGFKDWVNNTSFGYDVQSNMVTSY